MVYKMLEIGAWILRMVFVIYVSFMIISILGVDVLLANDGFLRNGVDILWANGVLFRHCEDFFI